MKLWLNMFLLFSMSPIGLFASEKSVKLVTGLNANNLIFEVVSRNKMIVSLSLHDPPIFVPVEKDTLPKEIISIVVQRNNFERRGIRYILKTDNGSNGVGMIQIGVFSDPNSALSIYKDHLMYTSMGPNKNLTTELGDKSVGWWSEHLKGFGRILFIRDNVVVDVSLFLERIIQTGGNANSNIDIAKAIDKALVEGTLGVQRGSFLKVPRIVAVDTPKELISRSKADAKVRIAVPENPQDPNSKDMEIVRTIPFYVPFVSPDEKLEENKTFTYEVIYITPACVVTSKQVKLIVKPSTVLGEERNN